MPANLNFIPFLQKSRSAASSLSVRLDPSSTFRICPSALEKLGYRLILNEHPLILIKV
jgi:hypothetical protein